MENAWKAAARAWWARMNDAEHLLRLAGTHIDELREELRAAQTDPRSGDVLRYGYVPAWLPEVLDYVEFEGKDGVSAIFNPQATTEADLKAAYAAGKLEQVAPPATAAAQAPAPAPEAALAQEAPAAAAPLAGVSIPAPNAPAGVQEARARNLEAVVAPKVNTPTGGPGAAMARRAF